MRCASSGSDVGCLQAAMKHALHSEQQPVVFGFTVYESFESEAVAKTGRMPMPASDEKALGGHAVLCVGYDDDEQVLPLPLPLLVVPGIVKSIGGRHSSCETGA